MGWVAGDDRVIERAGLESTGLLFHLAQPYVSSIVADVGQVLLIDSIALGFIAFSGSWSRYLFGVARERSGPLARTLKVPTQSGLPARASLVLSAVTLAVLLSWWAADWDPLVTLFYFGGTFGGFGVMILFTLASAAAAGFFAHNPRGEGIWVRTILPVTATILLATMVVLAVINYDTMLGVTPGQPAWHLRWALPIVYGVILVAGIWRGQRLRRRSPMEYRKLGLGVDADRLVCGPSPTGARA
jgi:hypothetical protein